MTILSILGKDPVELLDEEFMPVLEMLTTELMDAYDRGAVDTFAALDAYVSAIEQELNERSVRRKLLEMLYGIK